MLILISCCQTKVLLVYHEFLASLLQAIIVNKKNFVISMYIFSFETIYLFIF